MAALMFFADASFSQSVFPYEEIRLDKPADYKGAETLALSAADYLLMHPYDEKNVSRERAFQFLVKWTGGIEGYDFNLRGLMLELAEDRVLMQIYLPAMTKFCLENKTLGSTPGIIEAAAIQTVLKYANDPANKFPLKKKTRKRLEAKV